MTLATKIIFITALILSIILPFGYYLLGKEKSRIPQALQTRHRHERLFLLRRFCRGVHHAPGRPECTGGWIRNC